MLIFQDMQPGNFLFEKSFFAIQGILPFNVRAVVSQSDPEDALINVLVSHRFTSSGGFSHILSHMLKS